MQNRVFNDLVNQEHIVEILTGAVLASRTNVESQEMSHAWIFTGPPGSGRSLAAVAFADATLAALSAAVALADATLAVLSAAAAFF